MSMRQYKLEYSYWSCEASVGLVVILGPVESDLMNRIYEDAPFIGIAL